MKRYDSDRGGGPDLRQSGFSYIELVVAVAVLAILATAAIPMTRWTDKRQKEAHLKISLRMMRTAIDQYKEMVDQGLIVQEDVEQLGYPLDLEELVDGVEVGDPQSPDGRVIKFLARIPVDPFTGEREWGLRSYQDDWDSDSWGGENVYDVYSLSDGMALDRTYYSDW